MPDRRPPLQIVIDTLDAVVGTQRVGTGLDMVRAAAESFRALDGAGWVVRCATCARSYDPGDDVRHNQAVSAGFEDAEVVCLWPCGHQAHTGDPDHCPIHCDHTPEDHAPWAAPKVTPPLPAGYDRDDTREVVFAAAPDGASVYPSIPVNIRRRTPAERDDYLTRTPAGLGPTLKAIDAILTAPRRCVVCNGRMTVVADPALDTAISTGYRWTHADGLGAGLHEARP